MSKLDLKEMADKLQKTVNKEKQDQVDEFNELKEKLAAWTDEDEREWKKQFPER